MSDIEGPQMAGPLELMTTQEAAALLRVSASTIRREVKRGRLRAMRVGRKGILRIPRGDLMALLESQEDPAL